MIIDSLQPKSDKELLEINDIISPDILLIDSCKYGYLNGIKYALNIGADPSVQFNLAIRWASINGHTEIVKMLLEDQRVDPTTSDNEAIRCATYSGHTEIVNILMKDQRVDPSANDNSAIRWASYNGHIEIVKLLLADQRVDPTSNINFAVRYATQNGHHGIVELLLKDKRVYPSTSDNKTTNEQVEIVNRIINDNRVIPISNKFKKLCGSFGISK